MFRRTHRETQETEQRNPPPRKPAIIRMLRALKRQYHHRKRYEKKGATEHQINERMMARWTRRLGIFTIVLAFIAGISTWILYETDRTARRGMRAFVAADARL